MNLILLHVYVSSFEFKYTWNMYTDRVFMKFSQLLNISRQYYTLQSINIYSHFQGCLSMQFKAIQISKQKIYFVENGLFYDTRLHAYSNKKKHAEKNGCKKCHLGTGMIIWQFYTSNNCPKLFLKDMFCWRSTCIHVGKHQDGFH